MIVPVHIAIVRAALGESLSPWSLRVVERANARCDIYQWQAERHFDSAHDVADLGALWRRGLRRYLTEAVERTAASQRRMDPRDWEGALQALGMASHALADFYAHTNWVELYGASAPLAPLLGARWPDNAFPADLGSGYFSLRYGIRGCPTRAGSPVPPAGHRFCHETLNKDAPQRGHGADPISPSGPTHHAIAVRLAQESTRALWAALRAEVSGALGDEALAAKALAWIASRPI